MSRKNEPVALEEDCRRLHRAELELAKKRIELVEQIPSIVESGAESVLNAHLEGRRSESPVSDVAQTRAEIAMLEGAVTAARNQRYAALQQIKVSQANQMRKESRALRQQAEKHLKTTNRILAELKAHEGCEYAAAKPAPPSLLVLAGGGTMLGADHSYAIPISTALMARADFLEAQAIEREHQQLLDFGELEASSAIDLMSQIEELDALRFGPSLIELYEWIKDQTEGVASPEVRLHIAWGRGELLPQHCRVLVGASVRNRVPLEDLLRCVACEFTTASVAEMEAHVANPGLHPRVNGKSYATVRELLVSEKVAVPGKDLNGVPGPDDEKSK